MSAGKNYSFDAALQAAYARAELVLSVSEHTTEMIRLAFPALDAGRVVRQIVSIGERFAPKPKQTIITFMPRKLGHHAKQVCFFLAQYLPQGWSMMPIIDKNEQEVAAMLTTSSIFLSFSELEGLALPPLEAAASGNVVVGYTGEAAKEYFAPPVFRAVVSGDIKAFVDTVGAVIADVDAGLLRSAKFAAGCAALSAKYSAAQERVQLMHFATRALASRTPQSANSHS
jgi:glycosyltransferase involved in cell wall biosynthesis